MRRLIPAGLAILLLVTDGTAARDDVSRAPEDDPRLARLFSVGTYLDDPAEHLVELAKCRPSSSAARKCGKSEGPPHNVLELFASADSPELGGFEAKNNDSCGLPEIPSEPIDIADTCAPNREERTCLRLFHVRIAAKETGNVSLPNVEKNALDEWWLCLFLAPATY
eukprot:scaffold616_cov257-Pinguiococcus_pyrenoidosus.AAC.9